MNLQKQALLSLLPYSRPAFPRSAADVANSQQTHLQRYSQSHFNLMPQSCDHFNVSHDSFLLKRKDNYEEICCKIAYSFY